MIRVLSKDEIAGLEFPDAEIQDFELSNANLKFIADGCYLEGEGVIDERVSVSLDDWEAASARRYDGENQIDLDWSQAGSLREICECSFSPSMVKIAGFERISGHWQSFELHSPKIYVAVG